MAKITMLCFLRLVSYFKVFRSAVIFGALFRGAFEHNTCVYDEGTCTQVLYVRTIHGSLSLSLSSPPPLVPDPFFFEQIQ